MFPEIRAALAKKGMTIKQLSEAVNEILIKIDPKKKMEYQTMLLKLQGKYDFSLPEAMAVKAVLGAQMPLDELFAEDPA